MRWLFGNWRHLRVGTRLIAGFALILLLTVLVAMYALIMQSGMQHRTDLTMREHSIGLLAEELGAREKSYMSSRDPGDARQISILIDKMRDRLGELSERWSDADLKQVDDALKTFSSAFGELSDHLGEAVAAQVDMLESAQKMSSSFYGVFLDRMDVLSGDVATGNPIDTMSLFQLEQVVGLNEKLQKIRDSELRWVLDRDEEHFSNWEVRVHDADNTIKNLAARTRGEGAESLSEASEVLSRYKEAFEQYYTSYRQSRVSAGEADQAVEHIGGLIQRLQDRRGQVMQAEGKQDRMRLMVALAIAIVVGAFSAWLIRRSIVRPLHECVQMASRVSEGDLSLRDSGQPGDDEVGQLQRAMQLMAERLNGMVKGVRADVLNLDQAAGDLSAVSSRTNQRLWQQQSEAGQVASAVHQMTMTAQEVAKNAAEASEAAQQVDQLGLEGQRILGQTQETGERLVSEMSLSNQAMQDLEAASQQISKVLDVIGSVAEQTNLLALNAAIEAARAGDHGRGFAVVADEVRTLASRTGESICEIQGLIDTLHTASGYARERMEDCQVLSRDVHDLSEQSSEALGRIVSAVSLMEEMNQQIATAAEEQSAVSEQISQSVGRVKSFADDSLKDSEELGRSVEGVRDVGRRLNEAMGRFAV